MVARTGSFTLSGESQFAHGVLPGVVHRQHQETGLLGIAAPAPHTPALSTANARRRAMRKRKPKFTPHEETP